MKPDNWNRFAAGLLAILLCPCSFSIHKPRASIRKQLSETKQAASPKKAAARNKQHKMEV